MAPKNQTTRVLLTIHAVTDWNEKRLKQGHLDTPINARGQLMAAALARVVSTEPLTAIYSSDLRRARETARPIAGHHQLPLQTDLRLREMRWVPEWGTEIHPVLPFFRETETPEMVLERFAEAITEIAEKHGGETIMVVSHGAAVRWFIHKIIGSENGYAGIRTAINRLDYADGQWRIVSLNENGHIDRLQDGDNDQLGKD